MRRSFLTGAMFATALTGVVPSAPLSAQLVFEAKAGELGRGGTWSDKLVMPKLSEMTFRWKWDGRDTDSPVWQLAYPATGRGEPAVVKSGPVPPPTISRLSEGRQSDYSSFQISPGAIPSTAPSLFNIRMKIGATTSPWIPVTVRNMCEPPGSDSIPVTPPVATRGGLASQDVPLWVKLTRIIARSATNDLSPTDEVYAYLGSVAFNYQKPCVSRYWVGVTSMEQMKAGDSRPVNAAWPSETVLADTEDGVMMFWLIENDGGNRMAGNAAIAKSLDVAASKLKFGDTYSVMADWMEAAFHPAQVAGPNNQSGDDVIGAGRITFSQAELNAARAGGIVKKEIEVGDASHGAYTLRFQMGRTGTSPEAW